MRSSKIPVAKSYGEPETDKISSEANERNQRMSARKVQHHSQPLPLRPPTFTHFQCKTRASRSRSGADAHETVIHCDLFIWNATQSANKDLAQVSVVRENSPIGHADMWTRRGGPIERRILKHGPFSCEVGQLHSSLMD
ncbi:hypothetical protein GJ744_008203 [Endocarpon pusillum]|uniref:Uncharacterized protein n=1 Tax=Endocarpon pusillum TaxID=364733 RepID=A0A8H7AJJ1_9EURO|nr:hypothetical protein GJ744_008203 [Endocarpon pusillum]